MSYSKAVATARVFLTIVVSASAQVHVSPAGNDTQPGTAAKPVATIAQALKIVDTKGGPGEIVLQEGVYTEDVNIPVIENAPPLTVTAARGPHGNFVEVVFDYGHRVEDAEPVQGVPGVYRVPIPETFNNYQSRRSMWEADTRVRYRGMADPRAVAAFPASFRFQTESFGTYEGYLYFHTSDGRPPAEHEITFNIGDSGFSVQRDNVTVQGLQFRNGGGVGVVGENTLVEDCSAWNIERAAVYVSGDCPSATVRRFTATDVGAGVYSGGGHTIVEECRLFRAQDAFESLEVAQNTSAGIQIYSPGRSGLIRNNLVVGFRLGIFVKANKDAVTIEHNTVYGGEAGGEDAGITFVSWKPGSTMRGNIVSGHHRAYWVSGFGARGDDVIFRDNLLWDVALKENISACFDIPRAYGSGQGVIMADPRFAAPRRNDFRLLPDSPALRTAQRPLGVLPRVPKGWQDAEPPTLSLTAVAPATLLGRTVELYWTGDHWNEGGGVPEKRDTFFETEGGNQWLVPDPNVTLVLSSHDNATQAVRMKLRVDDGDWSDPEPATRKKTVNLPADAVDTTLSVMVADEAGNWSEPAALRAFRATDAPKLAGIPTVYSTRHGFIVAFSTDVPCTARMEWGATAEYGQTAERPPEVFQRWNANDGGEWTQKRTGPRRAHHLFVLAPNVEAGKAYHYRLVLDDDIGHVRRTHEATVMLEGAPRTILLSPDGSDLEGAGTAKQPWKTLQFAVDRALPGDRIVLRDGVYTGTTTLLHGGIEGAPLVIEAENERRAALDAGKTDPRVLQMHGTAWVDLRGLEVRWFDGTGIQFTESPHVTLENLSFWNNHLIKGRFTGLGFYARRSPYAVIRGCVFSYMNWAFTLLDSPGFRMEHTTVVKQYHGGCRILFSTRDSTFINNSFTFTGNQHITAYERREDWETFTCDYNNFAAIIRDETYRRDPTRLRPENPIDRWPGGFWANEAKRVNAVMFAQPEGEWDSNYCYTLEEWQEVSGKDAHSIYARPLYVNPFEGDWRLQPESPNIGAGKDGATIGALGVGR